MSMTDNTDNLFDTATGPRNSGKTELRFDGTFDDLLSFAVFQDDTGGAELESTAEIPQLETRVGRDGKSRPAVAPSIFSTPRNSGKTELRFDGTFDDLLSFAVFQDDTGGFVARFQIYMDKADADLDSDDTIYRYSEIDVPLETLMPLVLSLGGSIAHYIAKDES